MYHAIADIFPDLDCERGVTPYLGSSLLKRSSPNFRTPFLTDFVFTVVRDPMATALSAFCEIDLRKPLIRNDSLVQYRAKYKDIPCSRCPACRYISFLDGIAAKEPLSHEFFHAFPQTVKTHVAGAFSAIIKTEALDAGLAGIAVQLGTRVIQVTATKAAVHSHSSSHKGLSCCSRIEASVLASSQLMARICQLYIADYLCFAYELPAACKA